VTAAISSVLIAGLRSQRSTKSTSDFFPRRIQRDTKKNFLELRSAKD
jgi:hypothetical protein